ncbi:DNA-processing protein DprA [Paenibacillus mendelii]|uniref:DNA-processing protein DprA n=1 Tax=Paenibacillus mendelii TaxID=206163 RepID=A0ABV6JGM9_9BACL|nr:DNA-processing protein DprA [Paenibacillus mendelii]MCQ6557931.1 DNA-processing protein DprA [Paenibacillus mendelii]
MKKHIQESLIREILITLHETAGIGWHAINKAVDYGDWSSYLRYEPNEWRLVGFRPEQAAAAAQSLRFMDIGKRDEKMNKLGITVITRYDSTYPEMLRYIPQPPWVLYAIGRIELLSGICMAIVGTRGPTAYGRKITSDLSEGLSKRCITVVSGLARGIDSVAHEGALRGEGGTVAVLGTPINVVYPPENRGLYRTLSEQGLILSEVPLGTAFHPGLFPLRNRIIAGLSIGTVVVEAAERSGSLITADQALEMNREVFAVPGPVSSPKSAGTNKLIRESGAKLISDVEHIMEEFMWLSSLLENKQEKKPSTEDPLTQDEELLYRLLLDQPRSTDELHELSSLPFGLLHSVLINLTIKRKIEQHPGSIYSVT